MRSGTQETRRLPCPYGVLLRQDASEMIRTEHQKRRRYERWGAGGREDLAAIPVTIAGSELRTFAGRIL
jgi:hypothetical protein